MVQDAQVINLQNEEDIIRYIKKYRYMHIGLIQIALCVDVEYGVCDGRVGNFLRCHHKKHTLFFALKIGTIHADFHILKL